MSNSADRPLRMWPGIVLVALELLLRYAIPVFAPDYMVYGAIGGMACGPAIVLWWLLFSRAPWSERCGAIALMVGSIFVTKQLVDVSLRTGAQGFLFFALVFPTLSVGFVAWAAISRRLAVVPRWITMALAIFVSVGLWTGVRTGGFTTTMTNDLHLRWTPSAEDKLVAQENLPAPPPVATPPAPALEPAPKPAPKVGKPADKSPEKPAAPKPSESKSSSKSATPTSAPVTETKAEWPGFRGPHHDGVVSASTRIKTDWATTPPVQIWKRPVGPGWSSFSVQGDRIYTQEQRGPDEVVSCYRLTTGEPVWGHRDKARFWESNGGPGPRGTPTLSNGRVYSFGATGILNVLDAATGALLWSHNAAAEANMQTPQWGFASSPIVVDDLVIVGVSGRLVAYDRQSGKRRWMGPTHGTSYSSPVLLNVKGVKQVLLMSAQGATSVALEDGSLLWEYEWKGYPIIQPAVFEGDILMAVSDSSGIRRIGLTRVPSEGADKWNVTEKWTSHGLKPYFNDFVINGGFAYGFDGSILACIDLKDGQRKWKGGRYGNGQMLLLADQNLLLVSSELGELALVQALPDQYKEFGRFQAIEGKTWGHPVLVGDTVLIRNGEEMAAFRLATEK